MDADAAEGRGPRDVVGSLGVCGRTLESDHTIIDGPSAHGLGVGRVDSTSVL